MALVRAFRAGSVALVVSPLLVGCAGLHAYRPDAEVTQSRYTTIVNYSTARVAPDRVDAVLVEVADILGVRLDPAVLGPRVIVATPDQIARLYEPTGRRFAGDLQARALYFRGRQDRHDPLF